MNCFHGITLGSERNVTPSERREVAHRTGIVFLQESVLTDKPQNIRTPPDTQNASGVIRKVGVEIEFAGLSPEQAAKLVAECFGGIVEPADTPFVFSVKDTPWGKFRIELDTHFVHPEKDLGDAVEESALPASEESVEAIRDFDTQMRELIGKASTSFVPTEIVSPPIPWNELARLTDLVEALRARGAKGTDDGLAYSFGVHLNPETAQGNGGYLLAIMRAYVLLSDWLREQIDVNATRKILPHIDPFPKKYTLTILQPDYIPDLETLIHDYFEMNPTRNRELDMLPLFKHLAPLTVAELTDDKRIKARPTFHYRLPDTRLSDPEWNIAQEWNRWVAVEYLAADETNLRRLAGRYLANADSPISKQLKEVRQWIEKLANR